ncbi:ABC-F type ribosomal protection protein [Mesobacillus foraminis]|uniref:ribosomal protection-like ABC-F family protein n=1 Tax=Mesobacillus foraminis TaxID=279826 RepID=UPI001BEBF080|nr:ABC-F type ribosomal protection protein [Mesobacillus foraminis]MBT2757090.1 ABC-F type ribosomal protection protein [Mesobacillus foraminis]
MLLIKLSEIEKSFGDIKVLQKANMNIRFGARVGLVGENGAGKTTLANILFGTVLPDNGQMELGKKDINIGYLKQSTESDTKNPVSSSSPLEPSIFRHSSKLGLSKLAEWSEEKFKHLSGGEKLKLSLAELWASKPDLLLLDEPTNHLDAKGMEWLITELNNFRGSVVIISHDRYFLDKSVNQIIELQDGNTKLYNGTYTEYRQEKERQNAILRHQFDSQQKKKERIEAQIANLRNWSEQAHRQSTKKEGFKEYYRVKAKKMDSQAKSKLKRLSRELEKHQIEKPKEEPKVHFQSKQAGRHGQRIIEVSKLEKQFGEQLLFSDARFYISHGEKIGIIGDNGAGKTTLLRILLGKEQATRGSIWISDSVKVGYLSQDLHDQDVSSTALQLTCLSDKQELSKARTLFANIGLPDSKITVPVKTLSLGERTRVKLVCMLLDQIDVLILDEPTNHLDLTSRESLEMMLSQFTGTILAVSHDLYFLNRITNKLLAIENRTIRRLEMGYNEFTEKKHTTKNSGSAEEQKLLLQNEITALIGWLGLVSKDSAEYKEIDNRLNELFKEKARLSDK